jgi:hypothetical protein
MPSGCPARSHHASLGNKQLSAVAAARRRVWRTAAIAGSSRPFLETFSCNGLRSRGRPVLSTDLDDRVGRNREHRAGFLVADRKFAGGGDLLGRAARERDLLIGRTGRDRGTCLDRDSQRAEVDQDPGAAGGGGEVLADQRRATRQRRSAGEDDGAACRGTRVTFKIPVSEARGRVYTKVTTAGGAVSTIRRRTWPLSTARAG